MPMLENSKIEEIRKSVNIIDVIGEYIPLTQRGRNYFCVCPFHDDHSPSMSISNDLQIYTCFSCGATGNVFKFLMDYEHITFMDALAKVAAKGGIDININTYTPRKVINNEIYQIYDIAAKFYQNNLNSSYGIEAKEYLKKSDIDLELVINERYYDAIQDLRKQALKQTHDLSNSSVLRYLQIEEYLNKYLSSKK